MVTAYPCAACGQTGWVIPNPCKECRGEGRVPTEMDVTVTVPPGIETGDRMRISGHGEAGFAGGPHGDLYVRFAVRPDDRFVRSGDDLVTWVDIPMTTASLGGEVTFTSLDGEEHLEVPRGTHAGDVFRIPGRGSVRGRGGSRGDLVVRAHVLTPTDLDDEQQELLRRLAEIRDEATGGSKRFASRLRKVLGMEG